MTEENADPCIGEDARSLGFFLLADEVEDEDVIEDGLENFDESLMVSVRKVNVETGAVLEGYDKTMRETFGAVFGADVCAPL